MGARDPLLEFWRPLISSERLKLETSNLTLRMMTMCINNAVTGSFPTSRPVLVQLGSHVVKNMVMESLYKLKSMSERFKNIIIAHDMTVKEREACKAL